MPTEGTHPTGGTPERVIFQLVPESADSRFQSLRAEYNFKTKARIYDSLRQFPTLYLANDNSLSDTVRMLNYLNLLQNTVRNGSTLRDVINNMIAIEEADSEDELMKACDRNRDLLYRMKIGPYQPFAEGDDEADPAEA